MNPRMIEADPGNGQRRSLTSDTMRFRRSELARITNTRQGAGAKTSAAREPISSSEWPRPRDAQKVEMRWSDRRGNPALAATRRPER